MSKVRRLNDIGHSTSDTDTIHDCIRKPTTEMDRVALINRLFFKSERKPCKDAYKACLAAAFETVVQRQKENASRMPSLEEMKVRLRESRKRSINNEDLLKGAITNLKTNGFKIHLVNGIEDAYKILLNEIGDERLVVKSKSNISKEMHLSERLEDSGIAVIETDIGDRIIQLAKDKPSHPTGPASHLNTQAIAEIVSRGLGREISPEPKELVASLTEEIKGAIERARIGVTGANAITAHEGSVVIVHNEGNISEISRLTKKHIILADTYKIYPDLEDAINMVKLQTYCATGAVTTSYIDIISGLSKTADIEKELFYGVHGPSEVVLILIKRQKLPENLEESAYCIGCGGCLLECPVYLEKGSTFGVYHKQGGIGVIQSAVTEGIEKGFENGLYSCGKCSVCIVNCPVSINIAGLISVLRETATVTEALKDHLKPYKRLARSIVLAANARGTLQGLKLRYATKETDIAYFPGCIATLNTPNIRSDIINLLKKLNGTYPQVIEGCCGGIWETLGFKKNYTETLERFLQRLVSKPPNHLVVSCPHCYDILWVQNKRRLVEVGIKEVLRLTEMIKRSMPLIGFKEGEYNEGDRILAYHDSCIFGRQLGIYDEPREVLQKAGYNSQLVEMDKAGERARCCGFALLADEPDVAKGMSQRIVDSAIEAGAGILITNGCPGCYYALKNTKGIEVEDISGFLCERIKPKITNIMSQPQS